jgi:hypothetical protein
VGDLALAADEQYAFGIRIADGDAERRVASFETLAG